MVICMECGANDLHMVQLMPLPPIISCIRKIQNCVCVCVWQWADRARYPWQAACLGEGKL